MPPEQMTRKIIDGLDVRVSPGGRLAGRPIICNLPTGRARASDVRDYARRGVPREMPQNIYRIRKSPTFRFQATGAHGEAICLRIYVENNSFV